LNKEGEESADRYVSDQHTMIFLLGKRLVHIELVTLQEAPVSAAGL